MALSQMAFARNLLTALAQAGVEEVILCPGARNAPLVAALGACRGLAVHSFFEERSAGFFAIGRMQSTRRPVVVCTTSGTAVAELLPAVIEADYQSLPLVVLSADRPVGYRGTGAPQTIIQPGLFSHYVSETWDLTERSENLAFNLSTRPVHINVCFDEPLIDEPIAQWTIERLKIPGSKDTGYPVSLDSGRLTLKPLITLGGLTHEESQAVLPVVKAWGRPVYAEALSQLRGQPELSGLEIRGGDDFVSQLDIDGVIRLGQVPTLRFWRDLETKKIPVVHFCDRPFPGLAREKTVYPLAAAQNVKNAFSPWTAEERAADTARAQFIENCIHEFPLSECALMRRLSESIPADSRVFLGNSLPIREWDFAATRETSFSFFANRGVNGIDGLVSTTLGLSEPGQPVWGVIGDLSALYDLSGLWPAREWTDRDITLVVINNGGGKIFERIFRNPLFENNHNLDFAAWAKMWNWTYQKIETANERPMTGGRRIVEIVPNADHTAGFYKALGSKS